MGSLTRRMRKHAPVEPYAVKRLPATPATVTIRGQRIDPLPHIEFADDARSRSFLEAAPQPRVFTIVDEVGRPVPAPKLPEEPTILVVEPPRRRLTPMQLIAALAMLGVGLPPRGER